MVLILWLLWYFLTFHNILQKTGVVGALAAFMYDDFDIKDPRAREIATIRMIAKLPTLAAIAYRTSLVCNFSSNFKILGTSNSLS